MAQDKLEQAVRGEQVEEADPVLGFTRVIRYRSESLSGLRIKL